MQIVFETPRLILRKFTEDDFAIIQKLNNDPEVIKYLHEPFLETEEQAKDVLSNIILPQYKNNLGRWAIHTKDYNEFIGWCGLKYVEQHNEIDLGYRLQKSAWGNGFATEAAKYTLDHGFKKLSLAIITARAHIENIASLKVPEKIGMRLIREEVFDNCPVKTYTVSNTGSFSK